MTAVTATPLQVALDYFEAWTSGELDRALQLLAPDVVCDAPAGRIAGVEAYRAFLGPFAQRLIRATLLTALGDDERAVLVYDTASDLVASGPAAECLTVVRGRITHDRFIFDRLPFDLARRAATPILGG